MTGQARASEKAPRQSARTGDGRTESDAKGISQRAEIAAGINGVSHPCGSSQGYCVVLRVLFASEQGDHVVHSNDAQQAAMVVNHRQGEEVVLIEDFGNTVLTLVGLDVEHGVGPKLA